MKKKSLIIGTEMIGFIALFVFAKSQYIKILPSCWIYHLTGIQCLACGGTRCVIHILRGEWKEAFFSHMVFFIGILYAFLVNIIFIINLNKEKKIGTWIYPKYWYSIIFIMLLIIYTIARNLL